MDATNFVEKISQLVPNKQDILRNTTCSEEFADIYIQDLSIKRKATHTDVSPNFPVIDLIFNYDLSKLRIQVYSFNDVDDVAENDQFIYVGWVEAFLLAILKETGEIVATDWANPCSIVSYIAKNQGAFLDVLVELEKFSQKLVFGFITEKEENEINKYICSISLVVKPIGLPRDNRTLRSKPISQFFSVVTVRSLSLVSPCAAEAYVFIFFKHSKLTAHDRSKSPT